MISDPNLFYYDLSAQFDCLNLMQMDSSSRAHLVEDIKKVLD